MEMLEKTHKLSIRKQCNLLCICRSNVYYSPKKENDLNLEIMRQIDEIHLKYPSFGIRRITFELQDMGYAVNRKRVRRLMKLMDIATIYPKKEFKSIR